jgi:hypothetical protein
MVLECDLVATVMRKVIYSMMVSLDGFIEGRDQNIDWAIIHRPQGTGATSRPDMFSNTRGCCC